MKRQLVLAGLILLVSLPVLAQEEAPTEPPPDPWKGALGLSYVDTSGNSETEAFGLDFKVERLPEPWGLEITGLFNRASDQGVTTAERYYLGGRAKRALGDRWELFGGLTQPSDGDRLAAAVGAMSRVVGEVAAAPRKSSSECDCRQTMAHHIRDYSLPHDWRKWFTAGQG